MTKYFIIPGLGNSGEQHWQTYFEKSAENFHRINQQEWDAPACIDWITTINKTLENENLSEVVLVGHSLGCSTIIHWENTYHKIIKGAFLVGPSDLEAPQYTFPTKGFTPIPLIKINFKTIVIASTNDEWVALNRAKYFANSWNSDFINIGDAGHINTVAGFGEWKFGLKLLHTYFD
jgi:uncharacterized protein